MWYCKIHDSEFTSRPKQMVLLLHKDRAKCTTSCAAQRLFPQHEVYFPMSFSFFIKEKKKQQKTLQHHGCKYLYMCTFSALLIQILNAIVYMYIIRISFLLPLYLPLLWHHAYMNEMKTNLLTMVVPFSSGLACDE